MAFGCEVHDIARLGPLEQPAESGAITDISLLKAVAIARRGWNRVQIGCIGQLVDVDDKCAGVGKQVPDHGRANEARTARDKDCRSLETHSPTDSRTRMDRNSG